MIDNSKLDIKHDAGQGKYFALINGQECLLRYKETGPGVVNFYSTYVPPELEGHGYAAQLTRYALEDAKAQNLKVIPGCSYVRNYIEKHS
ncbi:MAG: GNAT family N-acetyltransferase [Myxococcota bacterium]